MAKKKGKKFKREGKKIGPNAKIEKVKVLKISPTKTIDPAPAPLTHPAEATASYSASNNNGGASQGKEKEREKAKCLSGFIFMCNPSTKIECFQYRVFGLPSWQKEVVEKIKPGAKLFLYDFELKLLYGVYEAASSGNLNLEPAAFRGKFPSQVKFKIFKECLPLPEISLRHVITENYTGSKFNQELSKKQVKKLISSFRPLAASSSLPAPEALTNVSLSRAMPPSAMVNQFKHSGRRPVMEVPYIAEMQYSNIRPVVESQTVPMANYLQHGSHRAAAYVENVHPALNHPCFPSTSSYYVANSQRPSFTEGVPHGGHGSPYSRYRPIEERAPPAQVISLERPLAQSPVPERSRPIEERAHPAHITGFGRNRIIEERPPPTQVTGFERYVSMEERAHREEASILERQYHHHHHHHHQLPLQREAVYQDNSAADTSNPEPYIPSAIQTQVPLPPYHHQSPLHIRQDNVAALSSNPEPYSPSVMRTQIPAPLYHHQLPLQDTVASYESNATVTAQYTAPVSQPQIHAYSYSYATVPAQYDPSVVVDHAPVTSYYAYSVPSYYTYPAAGQLSHGPS